MNEYTKIIKEKRYSLKTIFTATLIISMFGVLFWGKEAVRTSSLLDVRSLMSMDGIPAQSIALPLYIIRERWWPIPLLFITSTTYLGKAVQYLLTAWYGVGMGVTLGIFLLRYGIKGILFMMGTAIPHYLLYVVVFLLSVRMTEERRSINQKFVVQLIILEMMVILGCVIEATVTTFLLKKMMHIL